MIYFVGCNDFVKIGYTGQDINKRLAFYGTHNPYDCDLLGVMPGDMADERSLHIKFGEYAHRGEWFILSEEIKHYIKASTYWDIGDEVGCDYVKPVAISNEDAKAINDLCADACIDKNTPRKIVEDVLSDAGYTVSDWYAARFLAVLDK